MGAAAKPEGFPYQQVGRGGNPRRQRQNRVNFGITLANISNDLEPGLLVNTVSAGSPADLGGVKPEDRLLTWNDEEIVDLRSWRRQLARQSPGDEITFEVLRGPEILKLKAVLRAATSR